MSADYRKQHYVPQGYCRFFSEDGKTINLVLRDTGQVVLGASIRNQCAENYFYGSPEIEKSYGELESDALRIIQRIRDSERLIGMTPKEYNILCTFIVFQRARTKLERDKMLGSTNNLAREYIRHNLDKFPPDPELKAWIEKNLDNIGVDPKQAHAVEILYSFISGGLLLDLDAVLLRNCTRWPFLFGDGVVALVNMAYQKVRYKSLTGLQTPGLQVYLPLGPRLGLMFFDSAKYRVPSVIGHWVNVETKADVDMLNVLQMNTSQDAAFFAHPGHEKYVRSLWQEWAPKLERPQMIDHKAPGYDAETGEYIGEIIHSFEPHPSFPMRLSFMEPYDNHEPLKFGAIRDRELRDVFRKKADGIDRTIKEKERQRREAIDPGPAHPGA